RMKELEAQVAANIALENLAIKDVKVTPAEVADFYRRNRSIFRLPSQSRATIALAENPTAAQAVVAMLKDGSINLDSIAGQPGVAVVGVNGFNMDWSRVASDTKRILGGKIATAPTKSVFTVPSKEVTFIVRIDSKAVETVEPFETAKGQAERLLRLRKAEPQANVLARLYRDAEIRFEATKYQVFFKDIEKAGQELK
ncbi:MAG: hypothetical protein SFU56_04335, partial [Capsulimonadales bacterium]|nr:hypothetical protein [Capsulimonadales bacterium]